jgi:hypothetical protein
VTNRGENRRRDQRYAANPHNGCEDMNSERDSYVVHVSDSNIFA